MSFTDSTKTTLNTRVYTRVQVFIDILAAQRPNNLIKQEKV